MSLDPSPGSCWRPSEGDEKSLGVWTDFEGEESIGFADTYERLISDDTKDFDLNKYYNSNKECKSNKPASQKAG